MSAFGSVTVQPAPVPVPPVPRKPPPRPPDELPPPFAVPFDIPLVAFAPAPELVNFIEPGVAEQANGAVVAPRTSSV
jgi:hypothetical protein